MRINNIIKLLFNTKKYRFKQKNIKINDKFTK